MRYEDILYNVADGIATITFNRPDVLNAVRPETWSELEDAVGQAEADDAVRVIVLTGAGEQAFVAGADISVMSQETGYIRQLSTVPWMQRVTCAIEDCPKPVIARINGYALGGGTGDSRRSSWASSPAPAAPSASAAWWARPRPRSWS